jgi:hypothetical protein
MIWTKTCAYCVDAAYGSATRKGTVMYWPLYKGEIRPLLELLSRIHRKMRDVNTVVPVWTCAPRDRSLRKSGNGGAYPTGL